MYCELYEHFSDNLPTINTQLFKLNESWRLQIYLTICFQTPILFEFSLRILPCLIAENET